MPDEGTTGWDDAVKGRIEFPNEQLEDLVLVRSDGRPTYNFASPVEDWLDGITHVIRGDDHVSNTPKQIQILQALGSEIPTYAHVPNVFGEDGKKLSKRHGAVSVDEFRAGGLHRAGADELPRPARLGTRRRDDDHVPGRADRAFLARARRREPGDVRLREARLDERRLPARRSSPEEYAESCSTYLARAGSRLAEERIEAAAPLVQEKIARLGEFPEFAGFLFHDVEPDPALLDRDVLTAAAAALEQVEPWQAEPLETALKQVTESLGLKPRQAFPPIRVAVTGSKISPGLYESLELLGRRRVASAAAQGRGGGSGLIGASGSSARWNSIQARRR